ncbi:alpha/beta fold hydrolase [Gaetbulibacter sp. M235]|uniref:alpha/beta hydrolase family protein n=1 Tax=Gaetbulibacter sp. M235 TaxID=3126510 RepID=UPI00374F9AF0
MIKNSIVIQGKHQKTILIDYRYLPNKVQKPIIIFCHGYKGFKDWGAWNLMADAFAEAGFCFIKFNFSHNGGTMEQPIDFLDLEAFGNNNYTKELDDLESVLDWACSNEELKKEANTNQITLLGHSRGGGIVIIKAEEDTRIKHVVTLASVSDYKIRFPKGEAFEAWKKEGTYYVENGRTKQQMPHYFQFHQDFIRNENRLNIKRAVEHLQIPLLIIHGDEDTSVSFEEAKALHQWSPKSKLVTIEGANHVFGASHPWKSDKIPDHLNLVIQTIISFLK